MKQNVTLPREGDLYKVFVVDDRTFEIRYGYYEESERDRVEPLPVFPDLLKSPVYTARGTPVTSLIQVSCRHYVPRCRREPEYWCCDCLYYDGGREEMGRCLCPERKRE